MLSVPVVLWLAVTFSVPAAFLGGLVLVQVIERWECRRVVRQAAEVVRRREPRC